LRPASKDRSGYKAKLRLDMDIGNIGDSGIYFQFPPGVLVFRPNGAQ
jgi:hypothetical protein